MKNLVFTSVSLTLFLVSFVASAMIQDVCYTGEIVNWNSEHVIVCVPVNGLVHERFRND